MPNDYRRQLLGILSRLDRKATEAQAIANAPGDTELLPWAEDLRETLVELQAKIEEKLDRIQQ